jgi:hypothetical protein
MNGKWHLEASQAASPGITTTHITVDTPTTGAPAPKSIPIFKEVPGNPGYSNNTAHAIGCTFTIANGALNGSCDSWGVFDGSHPATISGNLTLNSACNLGGTISVTGDTAVTIRRGHINRTTGTFGSGIGTQGTKVTHFTLVKD